MKNKFFLKLLATVYIVTINLAFAGTSTPPPNMPIDLWNDLYGNQSDNSTVQSTEFPEFPESPETPVSSTENTQPSVANEGTQSSPNATNTSTTAPILPSDDAGANEQTSGSPDAEFQQVNAQNQHPASTSDASSTSTPSDSDNPGNQNNKPAGTSNNGTNTSSSSIKPTKEETTQSTQTGNAQIPATDKNEQSNSQVTTGNSGQSNSPTVTDVSGSQSNLQGATNGGKQDESTANTKPILPEPNSDVSESEVVPITPEPVSEETQKENSELSVETRLSTPVIIELSTTDQIDINAPLNGEIHINGDGTITYTPKEGFIGIDTFEYTYMQTDDTKVSVMVEVTVRDSVAEPPAPASCQIYAVEDIGVNDSLFLTIDPTSDKVVPLGKVHKGYDIEAIAINPVDYKLYAFGGGQSPDYRKGHLFIVNAKTSDLTDIGFTGFTKITAAAFRTDGTLWAWSTDKGLIQVDLNTAQTTLEYPKGSIDPLTNSEQIAQLPKLEGLAWSTDGTLLYGSENRKLWVYDGNTFTEKCNNFPAEVEALETLSDGMLLFGTDASRNSIEGSQLYVYDPNQCSIVLDRFFKTPYNDIEAIAWPLSCQPKPAVTGGKITFQKGRAKVCDTKPQWITITGKVTLEPAESEARLETGWYIEQPSYIQCPKEAPECTQINYIPRIIQHGETFTINGWWPGIPDGLADNQTVELRFQARLLDMQDNVVIEPEIKILVGNASPECTEEEAESTDKTEGPEASVIESGEVKSEPAVEPAALETYLTEHFNSTQVVISDKGEISMIIANVKYQGLLGKVVENAVPATGQIGITPLNKDANNDGTNDFIITYANGTTQLLFLLSETEIAPANGSCVDKAECATEETDKSEPQIKETSESTATAEKTPAVKDETISSSEVDSSPAEEKPQSDSNETDKLEETPTKPEKGNSSLTNSPASEVNKAEETATEKPSNDNVAKPESSQVDSKPADNVSQNESQKNAVVEPETEKQPEAPTTTSSPPPVNENVAPIESAPTPVVNSESPVEASPPPSPATE